MLSHVNVIKLYHRLNIDEVNYSNYRLSALYSLVFSCVARMGIFSSTCTTMNNAHL